MSKIFIVSDTHFNHKTMIKEGWRKFKSVKEMNNFIINRWNKIVTPNDLVFHLGDVCIGKKEYTFRNIIPRLNGKIYFIQGNHDSNDLFVKTLILRFQGYHIELIHDPKDATGKTGYVIHGHIHGKNIKFKKRKNVKYFNAVIDNINFKPKLLNEIIGEMKNAR